MTRVTDNHPTPIEAKGASLYHRVLPSDRFEDAIRAILLLIVEAERQTPGAPRHLFLEIEGHQSDGNFDAGMIELQKEFLFAFAMPYLTEIHCPLYSLRNHRPQSKYPV